MIDAYTVGITLALDNGVSEGLTTIGRDLGTLNKIVDHSATGLGRLKRVMDQVKVPPGPNLKVADRPRTPLRARERPITRTAPPPSSVVSGAPEAKKRSYTSLDRRSDLVIAAVPPPGRSHGQSGQLKMPSAILAQQLPPAPLPKSLPFAAPGRSADNRGSAAAPALVLDRVQSRLSQPNSASSDVIPGSLRRTSSLLGASLTALADDVQRSLRPQSSSSVANYVQRFAHVPTFPAGVASAPLQHAVRASLGDPGAPSAQDRMGARMPNLRSAVPPMIEPRSPTLQGDVYLDGSRMGRWIVDQLAKVAERPRTGTTGFDPRMTATWPGAPIGT